MLSNIKVVKIDSTTNYSTELLTELNTNKIFDIFIFDENIIIDNKYTLYYLYSVIENNMLVSMDIVSKSITPLKYNDSIQCNTTIIDNLSFIPKDVFNFEDNYEDNFKKIMQYYTINEL